MGLDSSLEFIVGVPVEKLISGKIEKCTGTKTKYKEDTGKPYEVPSDTYCVRLNNGHNIEFNNRYNQSSILAEYFKKCEFDCAGDSDNFFNGVTGINVGERKSVCGCQTTSLISPDTQLIQDTTVKVQSMLKALGFSVEIVQEVKLYAVMDASY